jgi:glycosyltransferase involved in cell wall biosynthesis
MPKDYSLTAVVLSYNSEKKIEKCLFSLIGWVDEIILVDGQSSDRTIEIAEKSGAKIYSHKFLGSFAQERNFGTERAKGEWILQLDSDEVVSEEFKNKCDTVLPKAKYAAFKFLRKNFFLGRPFKHGGWYHWSQHLFKNGLAFYEGRVHERMIVNGEVGLLEADIIHFPFDSIDEFIERQNRYTNLQAKDIVDTEANLTIRKIRYNLTIKPFKLFKKIYLNKKGYKEGILGFIFAVLFSWVHFLKWAKVWEIYESGRRQKTKG